ncbi:MAG TPA: hypothetical protein VGN16_21160 [Acidobacteriaceae bacterium]|jgi:hypothetical protein
MPPVAPNQGLGTINVAMSNFMKDYSPGDSIVDQAAPRVPVDRQSFQYLIFDKSRRKNPGDTRRAPGARPGQIRFIYSTDKYFCDSHALEAEVPRETEATSGQLGFSAKKRAAVQVMDQIHLAREIEVASIYAGITGNTETLSGTSQWSDYSGTSHPIADIQDAILQIRKAGIRANSLIFPPDVVRSLASHPDIKAKFNAIDPGAITIDMLSKVLGLPILDAGMVVTSEAGVDSFVWGQNAYVAYVQQATSQDDLSVVKTFVDTTQGIDGYEALEYPDPYPSSKKDWLSGNIYYDVKLTAAEAAFAFINASTAYVPS